MKRLSLIKILASAILIFSGSLCAQIQHFEWQGKQREYLVRTPENYESLPVMFFLHGLGDNITRCDQEFNFPQVAADFGWMVVIPQALNAEDFIGARDLLELLFGGLVPGIFVRVVFDGELAVRLLDLVRGRRFGYSQNVVIILRHECYLKLPEHKTRRRPPVSRRSRRMRLAYSPSFFPASPAAAGPELTTTIAGFSRREPHR